ncbi:MAG: tRNA (adenosine(37)-N6)-threonylcarbamoyltransferase complex ATPase subunit type 1 TsaE [Desulfobacterales bacterium]
MKANDPDFIVTTHGTDHTRLVAEKIGAVLSSGLVIALTGDLGSGKTAFVQGLAKGLEVSEKYYINSPTYTLLNEYRGRMLLAHADLYRLDFGDDIESIGLFDMPDRHCVIAIEWADKLDGRDFDEYLSVHIEIRDENSRALAFTAHGGYPKMVIDLLRTKFKELKWL